MPSVSTTTTTMREEAPLRRLALFTALVLLAILAWDFSGLDLAVVHALASPQGFALQKNWWLDTVLHTRAKQLAIVIYLGLIVMVWWPRWGLGQLKRWQRTEIVVGITLGLITISTLKSFSLTSCPWDLQAFGGQAIYISHWQWGLQDGGSGRCFPGGHASSALAFLALALPWLGADRASLRATGQRILYIVLFMGLVLGMTQTLRGAHYPSHTFWTGFICWLVALANHLLFRWLAKPR